ncbi:MAG: zf-HC2 domain-containing protein [Acidobacteriota bacterium]
MSYKDKTPDCNMHESLVSYLYDEASEEERRRVEAHLDECRSCKEELEAFNRVRGMLQQWQIDDLPVVRVETSTRRSFFEVLRELFLVMPVWAKAAGAVAAVMVVLAVIGTEVSIGKQGFSLSADITRSNKRNAAEEIRAELRVMVNDMILASERQQKDELTARLVALESQLQNAHQADLVRLAASIEEQRARIKTIERDIDRREGLNLADILFSELTPGDERPTDRKSGD